MRKRKRRHQARGSAADHRSRGGSRGSFGFGILGHRVGPTKQNALEFAVPLYSIGTNANPTASRPSCPRLSTLVAGIHVFPPYPPPLAGEGREGTIKAWMGGTSRDKPAMTRENGSTSL